jgi:hypothetical protein
MISSGVCLFFFMRVSTALRAATSHNFWISFRGALSLRTTRKVAPDHSIEFEGQTYKIAPTLKKSVTVIYHPQSKLWVLEEPPNLIWPSILGHFSM